MRNVYSIYSQFYLTNTNTSEAGLSYVEHLCKRAKKMP